MLEQYLRYLVPGTQCHCRLEVCCCVGSKSKGDVVQVTWDNVEELEAYIAKLKKAADQLSIENRQLRRCHFNISDKVK